MQDITDSNEWDIIIPSEGDLESKLRAIERQLANQAKEFIFVLDADTGEELYRDKGIFNGIFDSVGLQNVLQGRRVIIITHNHPSQNIDFSLADFTFFFENINVVELRATSGFKTAILDNSNKFKPYTKTKIELTKEKMLLRNFRKITQEDYAIWYDTVLPEELKKKLEIVITIIDL